MLFEDNEIPKGGRVRSKGGRREEDKAKKRYPVVLTKLMRIILHKFLINEEKRRSSTKFVFMDPS